MRGAAPAVVQRVKRYRPIRQYKGIVPGTRRTVSGWDTSWYNNSLRAPALGSPNRARQARVHPQASSEESS